MGKVAVICALTVLLSGCCDLNLQTPGSPKLVTGISAVYRSGAVKLERQYSSDSKMRAVLDYLRLLKTYEDPQADPSAAEGSHIQITLRYSDGTEKIYHQIADQFFRCNDGAWLRIDPEQGQDLALILRMEESD